MHIEQVVRTYIDKTFHMSLATTAGDTPWICEVHFAYDDNLNLYFRSLRSRRHSQEVAVNSRVAGNIIDKYGLGDAAVGVYFEGDATLLKSDQSNQSDRARQPGSEQKLAFELMKARLNASDDILEESQREDGHQFYKIAVHTFYVFGAFDGKGSQKYELTWNGAEK